MRVLISCVLSLLAVSFVYAQPAPPNFVVIMADDLGYGDISPFDGWIETPHLERMAAEGMRLTHFYASGPVCSPTRAGLLTGRYQQRAGVPEVIYAPPERNRHHGLQRQEITFAEVLKGAGYATGIFGKWHQGYERQYNPVYQGFDEFRGYVSGNVDYIAHVDGVGYYDWWDGNQLVNEHGYVTHLITKHAVEFIESHRDRPFVLYVPHEAPHYPFQGPGDPPFRLIGQRTPEVREPEQVRQAYIEMVQEMDRGIGEILDVLERLELDSRTLVLFFSDNGATDDGSNGALRGYKGGLWEGGIRVPAIAHWPERIPAGTTSDEPAMTIDVMPTLLSVAGVNMPEGLALDGVDLSPVLFGRQPLGDRTLFWAYRDRRAVRDGDWKLVDPGGDQAGPRLFNLADDAGEQHDLAEQHPRRVSALQEMLQAWEADVNDGATPQPDTPGEIR